MHRVAGYRTCPAQKIHLGYRDDLARQKQFHVLRTWAYSQKFVSEGDKTGRLKSPSGSRGRALVGVWGRSPHK